MVPAQAALSPGSIAKAWLGEEGLGWAFELGLITSLAKPSAAGHARAFEAPPPLLSFPSSWKKGEENRRGGGGGGEGRKEGDPRAARPPRRQAFLAAGQRSERASFGPPPSPSVSVTNGLACNCNKLTCFPLSRARVEVRKGTGGGWPGPSWPPVLTCVKKLHAESRGGGGGKSPRWPFQKRTGQARPIPPAAFCFSFSARLLLSVPVLGRVGLCGEAAFLLASKPRYRCQGRAPFPDDGAPSARSRCLGGGGREGSARPALRLSSSGHRRVRVRACLCPGLPRLRQARLFHGD